MAPADAGSGGRAFTCALCGKEFSMSSAVLERYPPSWKPKSCPRCFASRGGSGSGAGAGAGGPRASRPAGRPRAAPGPAAGPRQPDLFRAPAAPEGESSGQAGRDPRGQEAELTAPIPADRLVMPVTSARLRDALAAVLATCHAGPQEGIFTDGACSGNPGPGGWGAVYVRGGEIVGLQYGREPLTTNNRMELRGLIAAYLMIDPRQPVTLYSDSKLCVDTITSWAAGWARRGWRRKDGEVKNLDLVRPAYQLSLARPLAELRWIKAHNGNRYNEFVDVLAAEPL